MIHPQKHLLPGRPNGKIPPEAWEVVYSCSENRLIRYSLAILSLMRRAAGPPPSSQTIGRDAEFEVII